MRFKQTGEVLPFNTKKSESTLSKVHTFNLKSNSPERVPRFIERAPQPGPGLVNLAGSKLMVQSALKISPQQKDKGSDSDSVQSKGPFAPMSYYVEEQAPLLEQLISNCEPILSEVNSMISSFHQCVGHKQVIQAFNKLTQEELADDRWKLNQQGGAQELAQTFNIQTDLFTLSELYRNDHQRPSSAEPKNPSMSRLQRRLRSLSSIYGDLKSRNQAEVKNGTKVGGSEVNIFKQNLSSNEAIKKGQTLSNFAMKPRKPGKEPQVQKFKHNLSHEDINKLKGRQSLRLNVRNILGVQRQDDWVFSLNIGNVMHLIPLCFEEFNYHLDNSHELSRDAMLEKVILLSVGYFCVGTQLRFLSKKPNGKITRQDSQQWHAQALEMACTFLPTSCPLVGHVISSYQKHHSPVSQVIPEDEEIEENLKVVRPLNDDIPPGSGRQDPINYHQIVRASSVPLRKDNQVKKQSISQEQQLKLIAPKEPLKLHKKTVSLKKLPEKLPKPPTSPQPIDAQKAPRLRSQQLKSMLSIYTPQQVKTPKKGKDGSKIQIASMERTGSGLNLHSQHSQRDFFKHKSTSSFYKPMSPTTHARKQRKQLTSIWKSPPPVLPQPIKYSAQTHFNISKKTQKASQIYSPSVKRGVKERQTGFNFHRPSIPQQNLAQALKKMRKKVSKTPNMQQSRPFVPSTILTLENVSPRTTRIETEPNLKKRQVSAQEELSSRYPTDKYIMGGRHEEFIHKPINPQEENLGNQVFKKSMSLQSLYQPLPSPLPDKTPSPQRQERREQLGMVTSIDFNPSQLKFQSKRKVGLAPKMPKQPSNFLDKQEQKRSFRRQIVEGERVTNFSPRQLNLNSRFKK